MRYLSLDIETTCLAPKKPSNILMLSMVVEDTNNPKDLKILPHFTCFFNQKEFTGSAYALAMNSWILDILSGRAETDYPIYRIDSESFKKDIDSFLLTHFGEITPEHRVNLPPITLAGKNVAMFDFQFLPEWLQDYFSYRVIDLGSVFIDFQGHGIPSTNRLIHDLKLNPEGIHDARVDAMNVINILRHKYKEE